MTLSKSSTNYQVQDKIGDVNVTGNVAVNEDGSININVNTDNGGYASYSKNSQGYVNFNTGFNEENDLIDYVQALIGEVFQELGDNQ
jgi:hypothetical protein